MIHKQRMTAQLEGDFVLFLIGMRFNQPWKIHKWLQVLSAMPKMLRELSAEPELGFIHSEQWFGRTTIMVQYWRSMEHLLNYAHNTESEHLPAWREFNRKIGKDGSVGIWHETYAVSKGSYENIYANLPAFGLGQAGKLQRVQGKQESAGDRLSST